MPGRIGKPQLIIVMGVSGAGKSTVGARLAERLNVAFADADAFHSDEAIAKMAAGIPLSDLDRAPWLEALGGWLERHSDRGGVLACSALKRGYRDTLRGRATAEVFFLHLAGDADIVFARACSRTDHFMPASLVESQYRELEPLRPDEYGATVDLAEPPDAIISDLFASWLNVSKHQAKKPPAPRRSDVPEARYEEGEPRGHL